MSLGGTPAFFPRIITTHDFLACFLVRIMLASTPTPRSASWSNLVGWSSIFQAVATDGQGCLHSKSDQGRTGCQVITPCHPPSGNPSPPYLASISFNRHVSAHLLFYNDVSRGRYTVTDLWARQTMVSHTPRACQPLHHSITGTSRNDTCCRPRSPEHIPKVTYECFGLLVCCKVSANFVL